MNRAIQARRSRIARDPRVGDVLAYTYADPGCASVWTVEVVRVTPARSMGPVRVPLLIHTEAWTRGGLVHHKQWFVWQWRDLVRRAQATSEEAQP